MSTTPKELIVKTAGQLANEWRERAEKTRNDDWCNTSEKAVWRSINEHQAEVYERCANELIEALPPPKCYQCEATLVICDQCHAAWCLDHGPAGLACSVCGSRPSGPAVHP